MKTDDFRITAFALNELPQVERLSVQAELNHYAECRHEVEAVLQLADLIRAEFAAEPSPELTLEGKLAIESELARTATTSVLRFQFIKLAALASVLAAFFCGPLYQLGVLTIRGGSFSYIPFIPLVSLWLIWLRRLKVDTDATAAWGAGAAATLSGAAILAFGWSEHSAWIGQPLVYLAWSILAFLLFLLGVAFICLGKKVIRSVLFPVALLMFTIPLPVAVRYPIESFRENSSIFLATNLFQIVGTAVDRTGSWLMFRFNPDFNFSLSVSAEYSCFGMSSYLVLIIASLIAGNLYLRDPWKRAALTLFVIPLDIVVNAVQIFTIGELGIRFGPEVIQSNDYRMSGITFFALSIIPSLLLLLLLRRSESRRRLPTP